MKLKKTGDWRREILGDMTVMNAEEVPEFDFLNDFCWHFIAFSVFIPNNTLERLSLEFWKVIAFALPRYAIGLKTHATFSSNQR